MNPILYAFLSDNFRRTFARAFGCATAAEVERVLKKTAHQPSEMMPDDGAPYTVRQLLQPVPVRVTCETWPGWDEGRRGFVVG